MNENVSTENLSIVIDGQGIITVPQEKGTLSISLIQHFTPDWIRMIQQGQAEGKCLSAVDYVDACLTNLAVPHSVVKTPVAYMTIMEGLETEDIASIEESIPGDPQPTYTGAPSSNPPMTPVIPQQETPADDPPANSDAPSEEEGGAELPDPPMEPAPKEESLPNPESGEQEENDPGEEIGASDGIPSSEESDEKTPWD